jgi:outer membrane protein assembly factor BamB
MSWLWSAPVRRGALGLILIAVVLFPGGTAATKAKVCQAQRCQANGAISWSRPLTGSWLTSGGIEGTVYADGQAYAAVGSGIAAIGFGLTLDAFDEANGFPRWKTTISAVPTGSAIMSVRVWPGVITVGVAVAAAQAAGLPAREEVVLDAVTGKQIRAFPAAWSGGAVSATAKRTVIVGPRAITCYRNGNGNVVWRDPTGPAGQSWQLDDGDLYVSVSASGEIGTAPVTAVRQVDLRDGSERLIEPAGRSFHGQLSGALDDELLFSSPRGLRLYSQATGRLTGFRAGAVPQVFDPLQQVLYVEVSGALIGVDPITGEDERGTAYPGPPGTYGVRDGVALGLDAGANGAAWGYNIAKKHVSWTTRALPWPHYFVDLAGIGGSLDEATGMVLLLTCAKAAAGGGQSCRKPMLVAIQQ